MFVANGYYQQLQGSYLFSEMAHRLGAFTAAHPQADIIRMGIGDVTRPLVPAVVAAMHKAVDEMGTVQGFRGYGPEQGYEFLRQAIAQHDYASRGVAVAADEVFVSDGAKCDAGNIQELFGKNCRVAVLNPVYPVYVDTNVMAGRSGAFNKETGRYENILYLDSGAENGFVPELPQEDVAVIYLCYPNNPTGTTLNREQLQRWVDYANDEQALILFDSAYEAYIRTPDVPHSIYEVPGADTCAIEFRSFSKTAGFTGTRCAYTVVPKALARRDETGATVSLHAMWNRRHTTKFNGVPYITQRGAEATYTQEGRAQIQECIDYYMENARIIREGVTAAGYTAFGGVDAPYIWIKTPTQDSWAFFDEWLGGLHLVGTPGVGFGQQGEGYFRLTAFSSRENTLRAVERITRQTL